VGEELMKKKKKKKKERKMLSVVYALDNSFYAQNEDVGSGTRLEEQIECIRALSKSLSLKYEAGDAQTSALSLSKSGARGMCVLKKSHHVDICKPLETMLTAQGHVNLSSAVGQADIFFRSNNGASSSSCSSSSLRLSGKSLSIFSSDDDDDDDDDDDNDDDDETEEEEDARDSLCLANCRNHFVVFLCSPLDNDDDCALPTLLTRLSSKRHVFVHLVLFGDALYHFDELCRAFADDRAGLCRVLAVDCDDVGNGKRLVDAVLPLVLADGECGWPSFDDVERGAVERELPSNVKRQRRVVGGGGSGDQQLQQRGRSTSTGPIESCRVDSRFNQSSLEFVAVEVSFNGSGDVPQLRTRVTQSPSSRFPPRVLLERAAGRCYVEDGMARPLKKRGRLALVQNQHDDSLHLQWIDRSRRRVYVDIELAPRQARLVRSSRAERVFKLQLADNVAHRRVNMSHLYYALPHDNDGPDDVFDEDHYRDLMNAWKRVGSLAPSGHALFGSPTASPPLHSSPSPFISSSAPMLSTMSAMLDDDNSSDDEDTEEAHSHLVGDYQALRRMRRARQIRQDLDDARDRRDRRHRRRLAQLLPNRRASMTTTTSAAAESSELNKTSAAMAISSRRRPSSSAAKRRVIRHSRMSPLGVASWDNLADDSSDDDDDDEFFATQRPPSIFAAQQHRLRRMRDDKVATSSSSSDDSESPSLSGDSDRDDDDDDDDDDDPFLQFASSPSFLHESPASSRERKRRQPQPHKSKSKAQRSSPLGSPRSSRRRAVASSSSSSSSSKSSKKSPKAAADESADLVQPFLFWFQEPGHSAQQDDQFCEQLNRLLAARPASISDPSVRAELRSQAARARTINLSPDQLLPLLVSGMRSGSASQSEPRMHHSRLSQSSSMPSSSKAASTSSSLSPSSTASASSSSASSPSSSASSSSSSTSSSSSSSSSATKKTSASKRPKRTVPPVVKTTAPTTPKRMDDDD
jgi:Proteasome complex subunit Rpn13, Pru domain